jgi:hypothetical protein
LLLAWPISSCLLKMCLISHESSPSMASLPTILYSKDRTNSQIGRRSEILPGRVHHTTQAPTRGLRKVVTKDDLLGSSFPLLTWTITMGKSSHQKLAISLTNAENAF